MDKTSYAIARMNLFEKNDLFQRDVGVFILTFSTVEFQIGVLASVISKGVNSDKLDPDIIGLDLNVKLKIIRDRLNENPQLSKKWEKLEGKLSRCNDFRRFLSHGIVSNHVPNPHLTGLIRAKRNGVTGFRFKKITKEDLSNQVKDIIDINAGKNGLGVLAPEIKCWLKE